MELSDSENLTELLLSLALEIYRNFCHLFMAMTKLTFAPSPSPSLFEGPLDMCNLSFKSVICVVLEEAKKYHFVKLE